MIYYKILNYHLHRLPCIVMVHGFTHNHQYFSAQIPVFREQYRLLLVDLRGHGLSKNIPGPYGVEEYADDILQVMDATGIKEAHYWGTHTGAAIGLVLALRQPERFISMILEGTFLPGFSMPRAGELIERARKIAAQDGIQAALQDWYTHADWFEGIRRHPQLCRAEEHQAMTMQFSGMPWLSSDAPRAVTPVAAHLQEIAIPTLVYNGDSDLPDFKNAAGYLHQHLPSEKQQIIPETGGFPAWENPTPVNSLVMHFLQEQY